MADSGAPLLGAAAHDRQVMTGAAFMLFDEGSIQPDVTARILWYGLERDLLRGSLRRRR